MVFLIPATISLGQGSNTTMIISKHYGDSIVLRWAPLSPAAWNLCNKYGYTLERYTITRDSVLLDTKSRMILTPIPLKPKPLEDWEELIETDPFSAIIAQAIYGENFDVNTGQQSGMAQIMQQVKELERRYSFAVFSADLSAIAANYAGLRWADHDIRKNETYIYRVIPAVPPAILPSDTAFVYVRNDWKPDLHKPFNVKAEFEERKVTLSWDENVLERKFSAYQVERSDDGGRSFHKISELPIINTYKEENNAFIRKIFKEDSITELGKTYYWRVLGLTPFAEKSLPSDTVQGSGYPLLESPVIREANVINNKVVFLRWTFSEEVETATERFQLLRTENPDAKYEVIADSISVSDRAISDQEPYSSNYYRIKAIGKYGQTEISLPYFAQLIDSIPPAPPVGLRAEVDTTGIVRLSWNPNSERDLHGYRVFSSNFRETEFNQITSTPTFDPVYYDTLNLKTLTKSIFYCLSAVDTHYNPSDFSEILEVKRPDIIPPVPPVFAGFLARPEGIELNWINSSSADVVSHHLYRNSTNTNEWELIAAFDLADSINTFLDNNLQFKKLYQYTIVAVDDSGLESPPATPVSGKRLDTGLRPVIEKAFVNVRKEEKIIQLAWNYKESGVDRFWIYRSANGAPLTLLTTCPGNQNQIEDKMIGSAAKVIYRVKAVFEDGAESPLTKEIVVEY